MPLSHTQQFVIWVLPILFAITLHEAAHAYVASYLGDPTARRLGRVSLNPLRHIDPIGSILVPIAVLFLSKFTFSFGWAKPVPIQAAYFKKPRRDLILATAAGPLSNFLMALLWGLFLKISLSFPALSSSPTMVFIYFTSQAGILINLVLAYFNLIPLLPLDGGQIFSNLLPPRLSQKYEKLSPFGFLLLLALLFTGLWAKIINPLLISSLGLISYLFRL